MNKDTLLEMLKTASEEQKEKKAAEQERAKAFMEKLRERIAELKNK